MRNTALTLIGLVILLVVLINFTPVQNFIARKAASILAEKLQTTVSLKYVRIDFANHVVIEGLYIQDKANDTLLYAGEARVRITDWFFVRKDVPVLKFVGLKNTYAHLYRTRTSDVWNYQFVIDAFDTGPSQPKKKKQGGNFEMDLEKVKLENVRFHMDDAWVGSDMDFDVGSLLVDANEINLNKKLIDVDNIDIEKVAIQFNDYEGGRPPKPRVKKVNVIDTTAFNTDNWIVKLKSLKLDDCFFGLESGTGKPLAGEFDPEHMAISGIDIDARNLTITKDTLRAELRNLAAVERCGIIIKKAKADVTVSPNASICKNLFLQTANSTLKSYYAMHYTRFPDFNDYINKVVMVAELDNATIHSKDVAYFAPVLRQYPTILKASGKAKGTVANISAQKLNITDGTSVIKGNLKMKGLPDIEKTYIEYNEGELVTTGQGILKYAPDLKNNPNIAIEKLTHIYFKGNFIGYISNFATNSILVTNLGSIKSDIKMQLPAGKNAAPSYAGTVTTDNFQLGTLLRQPQLGSLTINGKVSGKGFDPLEANITLDATVKQIEFNGYKYQNITMDGEIQHKVFKGNLLVDDPNLALAFYGNIDFSKKELNINAKANLLKSNFAVLNFTKDTITASADFDLNFIGSSIDEFVGDAKLYNINLMRNGHRLDLDSVYARGGQEDGQEVLEIESNALAAKIKGNYQLSQLHHSVQYYVAGYLPGYIKAPTKVPPAQDLTFSVVTREVDSLLAVVVPDIRGFSNATISGSLNTDRQQLTLDAMIPFGYFSGIALNNVSVNANGNFNKLSINAKAANVSMADSAMNGGIDVATTLGNNELDFKIATTSTNTYGTATLNGKALAHGDTLNFTLLPSEFFLNDVKWEIPKGYATLSKNYLFVRDLNLTSGLQSISIYSRPAVSSPALVAELANIDIAQLSNIAGLEDYQTDGRINGNVQVNDLFGKMLLTGDIKASDVKIGNDTLGNINLSGSYDAGKQVITLNDQSGIYRGNASVTASGSMSFDSTNNQRLVGNVQLNNTPVSWATPLVTDILSNLGGTLTGSIKIGGSAAAPDVDGSVKLNDVTMRVDFLGPQYTIPTGTVILNNRTIDFGDIDVYDAYENKATLSGEITHNRFDDMRLNINMRSSKFQVIDLDEEENEVFYGNLIASVGSMTVRGPIDDITIRIQRATPVEKSHLYLPIGSGSGISSYSYVTFKSYGTAQVAPKKSKNKMSISIQALANELAEISMVLDPSTGDAINATGTGTLQIDIPSGNDIRMSGKYFVSKGDYTFTLKQLYFKRTFELNDGSEISFNGPIGQTSLNVEGLYKTRARLYDLLSKNEKALIDQLESRDREYIEAKTLQDINIQLFMKGSLSSPSLSFKLALANGATTGSIATTKLQRVNQDDRELFNQVASLLLINTFLPSDGNIDAGATAGAISNVSQILSGTASSQLTNLISKLTGDENLSIDLKYKTYNFSDANTAANRNELSLGVRKNLFKDRLSVEVGSAYDWGRPTSTSNASNFNPVGDFRIQYQFKEGGNLRGYVFRTSSYDVLMDRNINRGGVGLNWHKTFNTLGDLFRSQAYLRRKKLEEEQRYIEIDSNQRRTSGVIN
ncbi:MAG TPA: translocation/assembly module TamB domain-containing protein [Flavipsychrobacter sp.]